MVSYFRTTLVDAMVRARVVRQQGRRGGAVGQELRRGRVA